jgi:hypothetical protein
MTAPVGRFSRLLTTNSTIHNSSWDREKAAARLQETVDSDEPVLIYGDYDVDGTTGIAVLLRAPKLLGARAIETNVWNNEWKMPLNEQYLRTCWPGRVEL